MIFMLDNKDLDLAEEQLDFIKNDLAKDSGELEGEINLALVQSGICEEKDCSNIVKHFLGLKYEWLKSMSLISYCKFLKTNALNPLYLLSCPSLDTPKWSVRK